MSATAIGSHSHSSTGHLSLMSCVRESSPPQDNTRLDTIMSPPAYDIEKTVGTKRKFWDVRKWFKRKNKQHVEDSTLCSSNDLIEPKETLRSRSTSELSIAAQDQIRRRSGSAPMHPGLSVSHDSVFHSPHSGSELDLLEAAQSSSSLSVNNHNHSNHNHSNQHYPLQPDVRLQSELAKKLQQRRHRGDTSEDDEGLPRSPCNSPTTTDGILDKTANKDNPTKSHSTCSDGSLLSMGSYEMDEDSFGQHSRHSSKLSLHDKTHKTPDSDLSDLDVGVSTPLNHSAAHHKVAVRPRRTHGAPRRSRAAGGGGGGGGTPGAGGSSHQKTGLLSALPTTPEVNEDASVRSLTPEVSPQDLSCPAQPITAIHHKPRPLQHTTAAFTETQLKCSSLPPGLLGPGGPSGPGGPGPYTHTTHTSHLNRSCSNAAATKSQDIFATLDEDDEKNDRKDSFLGWLLPRKSGRKKKEKTITSYSSTSSTLEVSSSTYSSYMSTTPVAVDANLSIRPNALLRSGPASRQRVHPIDIPSSPEFRSTAEVTSMLPRFSPEQESPFQAELRHKLGSSPVSCHQSYLGFTQVSADLFSTPEIDYNTPPQSPKSPWSDRKSIKSLNNTKFHHESSNTTEVTDTSKSRPRIPGLSALQQKVLSLNENDLLDGGCKSLTDFLDNRRIAKPVTKSHSFKSANQLQKETVTLINKEVISTTDKKEISKAASLDSVKNLDNRLVETVNETRVEELRLCDSITISGPSHITSNYQESQEKSITKIQLTDIKLPEATRRFSKDNIEVIEKDTNIVMSVVPQTSTDQTNKATSDHSQKKSSIVNIVLNTSEDTSKVVPIKTDIKSHIPILQKPQPLTNESNISISKKSMSEKSSLHLEKSTSLNGIKKESAERISTYTSVSETVILSSQKDLKSNKEDKPVSPLRQKPVLLPKSPALELTSKKVIQESQQNVDKQADNQETVVLRRKSVAKQSNEDEPELMKVFARRSLKLKDSDSESISQQVITMIESDKENQSEQSVLQKNQSEQIVPRKNQSEQNVQQEERRKSNKNQSEQCLLPAKNQSDLEERRKSIKNQSEQSLPMGKNQSDLEDRRKSIKNQSEQSLPSVKHQSELEDRRKSTKNQSEVDIRKPINSSNNKFSVVSQYQRTVSLTAPSRMETKMVKQLSLVDRPKTDSWIQHTRNESDDNDSMDLQPEIITSCLTGATTAEPDVIATSKPHNFNQRKAEWEKRAQEALKKNSP